MRQVRVFIKHPRGAVGVARVQKTMGAAHWSVDVTSLVIVAGGVLVGTAYWDVFGREPAKPPGDKGDGYTNSRFWLGIRQDTAMLLWPLQLVAGLGFVVFVTYLLIDARRRRGTIAEKGILSYLNGGAAVLIFAAFFVSSYIWPYATKDYLDSADSSANGRGDGWCLVYVSLSLAVAAVSAILMVAGAFEANMHPLAVWGVLNFALVVVLADAVGWNAKLIHGHYHNKAIPLNHSNHVVAPPNITVPGGGGRRMLDNSYRDRQVTIISTAGGAKSTAALRL